MENYCTLCSVWNSGVFKNSLPTYQIFAVHFPLRVGKKLGKRGEKIAK